MWKVTRREMRLSHQVDPIESPSAFLIVENNSFFTFYELTMVLTFK